MKWLVVALLVFFINRSDAIYVNIDYSFRVPEQWGVATIESANCCPFVQLPENETFGMIPPTVFGLGVQKGGTTTLYEHFMRHPKLIGTKKELHYLDAPGNETYSQYLRSWEVNRKRFQDYILDRHNAKDKKSEEKSKIVDGNLFEISPSYLFVPFAACKVKVISPNGKFIVFLRDPVDRAYSGLAYSANLMGHRYGFRFQWMRRSFWSLVRQGLVELENTPSCNFQTGSGFYTYNDCMGCMLRAARLQSKCYLRPFITLTNSKGGIECNFVGKEHILRGVYGPQIAWWFTLFHPSQFKIINSEDFFKDTMAVMKDIGLFLDIHPAYTKWMLAKSPKKANKGNYRKEDLHMVAFTRKVLIEYYKRPNLELYRLLNETGHGDFTPFEHDLRDRNELNCKDPEVIKTNICGDKEIHFATPEKNKTAMFPHVIAAVIHPILPERPKHDAEELMKQIYPERQNEGSQAARPSQIVEQTTTVYDPAPENQEKHSQTTTEELQRKQAMDVESLEEDRTIIGSGMAPEIEMEASEVSIDINPTEHVSNDVEQPNPLETETEDDREEQRSSENVNQNTSEDEQSSFEKSPSNLDSPVIITLSNSAPKSEIRIHTNGEQLSYEGKVEHSVTEASYFAHFLFATILIGFLIYVLRGRRWFRC